jgi:hypothetical protein
VVVYASACRSVRRVFGYSRGMHAGDRKYGWALRIKDSELRRLSVDAQNGVMWSRELARNRKRRRENALAGYPTQRLTIRQLAEQDGDQPSAVTAALRQARVELFGGDVSDSAAYNRTRQHAKLGPRTCSHVGCHTPLPSYAHASRRYCEQHRDVTARVNRHRQSRAAQ